MRHTDLYKRYRELENIEREELKKAVLAHGGEFRFQTEDGGGIEGLQAPIIMAGDNHWESNCDCYITRVAVKDGCLEIYGYDKEYGDKETLLPDIELGHLGYIIDEIPETDDVQDVTTELCINEIPIVSLCRADLEYAGYTPDVTDSKLQQVANQIGKYLERQDFFSLFFDNVRESCSYLEIPALENDENK